jgi:hypothetical protein
MKGIFLNNYIIGFSFMLDRHIILCTAKLTMMLSIGKNIILYARIVLNDVSLRIALELLQK